jgi:hypothetical protein
MAMAPSIPASASPPIVVRDKTCGSCGRTFSCCAGQCWCDSLKLDAVALAALRLRYKDCLCQVCLRVYAEHTNSIT